MRGKLTFRARGQNAADGLVTFLIARFGLALKLRYIHTIIWNFQFRDESSPFIHNKGLSG